jgi:acyl-CoA synthetase (AMP-forming)/AMP-acid ligase II
LGSPARLNIAARLARQAAERPKQTAVCVPHARTKSSVTFAELEALSSRYANALADGGIRRGMRTLLMVRPGIDFAALTFAMFKLGTLPVMIDPGMGVDRMLECIRQVDLHAFVGVPLAHAMRVLRRGSFRSVKHVVTVGGRWFWGGQTLDGLARHCDTYFEPADTGPDEPAAILFTSGSTGPAKGVVYEHGMFDAQVRLIQSGYGIEAGEVDLPTFPLFGLFSIAMGMTAIIPDMNPSHPAKADPAGIVRTIQQNAVTSTFGSPALWRRVAAYCAARRLQLPTLRRILIAGAPVPRAIIGQLHQVLSANADVFTPYGATEALPVASISGMELRQRSASRYVPAEQSLQATIDPDRNWEHSTVLPNARDQIGRTARIGCGTCVGLPFDDVDVTIIRITDEPIHEWSDALLVEDGAVGELAVAGSVVTKEYYGLPTANAVSKVGEGDTLWHRMGDLGYRDDDGRIWFCGRKAHRVETSTGVLFTECIEPVFNEHPDVTRSALVGIHSRGHQQPVMIVELQDSRLPAGQRERALVQELMALAEQFVDSNPTDARSRSGTETISSSSMLREQLTILLRHSPQVLFHKSLPVDARHNAKINREALAVWAARQLR